MLTLAQINQQIMNEQFPLIMNFALQIYRTVFYILINRHLNQY